MAFSRSGPLLDLRKGVGFALAPIQDTLRQGTRTVTSVFATINEIEQLRQEYITTARVKGLSEARVVWRHALGNTAVPLVTVTVLSYASLLEGSVLTETVFAWPGMGKLLIDSINVLDRPVIVAYLLIIVLLFVLINLVVDLLYTALDPRVRVAGRST